jgi:hypothetical protein
MRVEQRGGLSNFRFGLSVSTPFVRRCLNGLAIAALTSPPSSNRACGCRHRNVARACLGQRLPLFPPFPASWQRAARPCITFPQAPLCEKSGEIRKSGSGNQGQTPKVASSSSSSAFNRFMRSLITGVPSARCSRRRRAKLIAPTSRSNLLPASVRVAAFVSLANQAIIARTSVRWRC